MWPSRHTQPCEHRPGMFPTPSSMYQYRDRYVTRGQPRMGQNFQQSNRGRRERARPRNQEPLYNSQSSSNSNPNQSITSIGRGWSSEPRGFGRGSGLFANLPVRHLVPHQPFTKNEDRTGFERIHWGNNQNFGDQNNHNFVDRTKHNFVDRNNQPSTSHGFSQEPPRTESRERRDTDEFAVLPANYLCPKCGDTYQLRYSSNKYMGKIPLVLHCGHTMCQECIYQGLKNNKINCVKCSTDSTLTQEQTPICQSDVQNVFQPNYYVWGVMSFHREVRGHLRNLDNVAFAPRSVKKTPPPVPDVSERCCFASCTKPATLFCPGCEGIYCLDCSTVVHKSAKNLMSHQPVPRQKPKLMLLLENCHQHPDMPVEFFCKACDVTSCCYCVLNQHSDHERVALYQLNSVEMEEFKALKKNAQSVLKDVLTAQKRASRLANFETTPLKKEVSLYFADYHSKLQVVEGKLREDLDQFKADNRGLEAIQGCLKASAEQLKQLVAFDVDKIGDKKLNLRGTLDKLRKLDNIPRFLLNNAGETSPIRFVSDDAPLNDLTEKITLQKCADSEYRLVTERELPEGYSKEEQSDEEVERSISAIVNQFDGSLNLSGTMNSNANSDDSGPKLKSVRSRKVEQPRRKKTDMEKVDVQHINSMDSFYVQYKKDQSKLAQLSKDIENYVKMGGAEAVDEPQTNEMYLALYINEGHNKKEQRWCRARLRDVVTKEEEPQYDMFFIDYGKSQVIGKNRIRDIPPSLCQKKPFAIECMLHNPMDVNWNEKAHYSLARILNGKEVCMIVKSFNQGVHEVDLMIASSDGGVTSVIDILVHAHSAVDSMEEVSSTGMLPSKQNYYRETLRIFPNSMKFEKNQKEKVMIANVVDPYSVFVHMVQYQEAFKSLCHGIKKAFKNSKSAGCLPIEGTYALVEYKDPVRSNYHRALVKNVDIASDTVHVLLVDWGLNVVVATNHIRPLEDSFTRLESQAVLVKLAHIAPYDKKAVWSRVSSEFLHSYQRDVLKMVVQDVDTEVSVALFDCKGNVDVCINALMVEKNCADSTGFVSTKLHWPQYEQADPELSEEDGLVSALLKKVIDDADDESEEEEDAPQEKKESIDVVKVESPESVWIRFHEFRDTDSGMLTEVQVHYSRQQPTKSEWNEGEMCVTEWKNQYVRGRVLEKLDVNEFKVFLLDKVEEIVVPSDKLYVYVKYFSKYKQVIVQKCHLAHVRPAGDTGNWSKASVEALQELCCKNHRLYASIVAESGAPDFQEKGLPIELWYGSVIRGGALDPDRIKYVSINNSLVKLGYAAKIPRTKIKKAHNGEELLKGLLKEPEIETKSEKTAETAAPTTVDVDSSAKEEIETAQNPGQNDDNGKEPVSEALKELSLEERQAQAAVEKQPKARDPEVVRNWNELVELDLSAEDAEGETLRENNGKSPEQVAEVAILDWVSPFRLLSSEFEARITCVETGGHLFLRSKEIDTAYCEMEKNIATFFEAEPPELTDQQWQPGELCTIKYTDNKWYRGKVLKIKSPEVISVLMVDYGSDHDLSPEALYRQLLFTTVPVFATKVKLDAVYPRSGSWLTSDYDNFHVLVTDWCRIKVVGPKEVEVPMVEVYNSDGVFVNQKLIDVCPNLSRFPNFPVQRDEEEVDDDDVVIETIDGRAVEIMSAAEIELGVGTQAVFSATSTNQEYKVSPLPRELLEGKHVFMEIGKVVSFNRLTVALPKISEELYDMTTEIQDLADTFPVLTDLKVGAPCLAQFSEDEVLYRAQVTDVKSVGHGFVQVMFVDYGNYESVPVGEVKVIPPRYLELPQQCWEVSVNIGLKTDSGVAAVNEVMNRLVRKCKRIKIVKEDPPTVDLYNADGSLYYAKLLERELLSPLTE